MPKWSLRRRRPIPISLPEPAARLSQIREEKMMTGLRGKRNKNGQALMELAVFGTLFLLILSALIGYGLKYNFQQRSQMISFRRAMAMASASDGAGGVRGTGSYSLSQTYHIPDAAEEYGVGVSTS